MLKILALIGSWLLKNSVQTALKGAGLSVVSYLVIIVSIRAAFDSLIDSAYSVGADVLSLMGIYGIDHVLSAFISVAVFLLTLNQGKLTIKKAL